MQRAQRFAARYGVVAVGSVLWALLYSTVGMVGWAAITTLWGRVFA